MASPLPAPPTPLSAAASWTPQGRAAYMLDLLASDVLALSRRLLQETGQEQVRVCGAGRAG